MSKIFRKRQTKPTTSTSKELNSKLAKRNRKEISVALQTIGVPADRVFDEHSCRLQASLGLTQSLLQQLDLKRGDATDLHIVSVGLYLLLLDDQICHLVNERQERSTLISARFFLQIRFPHAHNSVFMARIRGLHEAISMDRNFISVLGQTFSTWVSRPTHTHFQTLLGHLTDVTTFVAHGRVPGRSEQNCLRSTGTPILVTVVPAAGMAGHRPLNPVALT
jgi:hypothetical protein